MFPSPFAVLFFAAYTFLFPLIPVIVPLSWVFHQCTTEPKRYPGSFHTDATHPSGTQAVKVMLQANRAKSDVVHPDSGSVNGKDDILRH